MHLIHQRISAMALKVYLCIVSVAEKLSLRRTAGSVQPTYYVGGRLMSKHPNTQKYPKCNRWTPHHPRLKHGCSKRSSHPNVQLQSMVSDGILAQNGLSSQSGTTAETLDFGQVEQLMVGSLSTSCLEAAREPCGMIPDLEAALSYARTYLAQRGVPKQDIQHVLSLARPAEFTNYRELRQHLKALSYVYAYSGGSMPMLLAVKPGSNSGERAVY